MRHELICTFFIIFVFFDVPAMAKDGFIIEGVSIVLRHGHRTPDKDASFPNDPQINRIYPEGFGALTQKGKQTAFNRGVMVRQNYRSLMSGRNIPSLDIVARTTNRPRTNMTARFFLGGMFQKNIKEADSNFNEDIIPASYLYLNYYTCKKFSRRYQNLANIYPEVREKLTSFEDFYQKVYSCTGLRITDIFKLYVLAGQFQSQESIGIHLLPCAERMYKNGELDAASLYALKLLSYDDILRKMNGGVILRNITNSMDNLVRNGNGPKIFLYSGHDTNVAAIIFALNIDPPKIPYFCSAVVVELYKKSNKHYVKILYYPDDTNHFEVLKLKNCDEMCPLERFKQLTRNNIPTDEEMSCD